MAVAFVLANAGTTASGGVIDGGTVAADGAGFFSTIVAGGGEGGREGATGASDVRGACATGALGAALGTVGALGAVLGIAGELSATPIVFGWIRCNLDTSCTSINPTTIAPIPISRGHGDERSELIGR